MNTLVIHFHLSVRRSLIGEPLTTQSKTDMKRQRELASVSCSVPLQSGAVCMYLGGGSDPERMLVEGGSVFI